jgi:hypothetical protein
MPPAFSLSVTWESVAPRKVADFSIRFSLYFQGDEFHGVPSSIGEHLPDLKETRAGVILENLGVADIAA